MGDRSFHIFDTSLCVSAFVGRKDRIQMWSPDWETFNRLVLAITAAGFVFDDDPYYDGRYKCLSKYHRLGHRETAHGTCYVTAETYPAGCKFTFYQEVVTTNRNGGRYDFDKRQKMPYLIGKAFERAIITARAHLLAQGFTETAKVASANPDPLAYFNDKWDGESEKSRGVHRFKRGADGWPDHCELAGSRWNTRSDPPFVEHGSVWYFRHHNGYLMRGRAYGGINAMWLVVYGPGKSDYTHVHRDALFQCQPSTVPRRLVAQPHKRVSRLLEKAVETQDFERAIVLRDVLKAIMPPEAAKVAA